MAIIKICLKVNLQKSYVICILFKFNSELLICLGILGMCSSKDVWEVWNSASSSGLLLFTTFFMEIHLRRKVFDTKHCNVYIKPDSPHYFF